MSTGTDTSKRLRELTLVFCRRTNQDGTKEILLGLKKRGFGKGKWNGFGGKLEPGETVADAAKRELLEESHVTAKELSLRGVLIFNVPSYPTTMRVHVYEAISYEGEPKESEEMRPKWFPVTELPQKEMWGDDAYWMPMFLAGNLFYGEFDYSDDEHIEKHTLVDMSVEALQAATASSTTTTTSTSRSTSS